MTNLFHLARRRLAPLVLLMSTIAVVAWPASASAHTDFDSSVPSDGTTIEGSITSVTISFTNPAIESGNGFQLLGPDGVIREPVSLDPTDGTEFIVTFDPPLDSGEYGFRWEVQAGDAHPIQGSFQFTVAASATTAIAVSTTLPSATTAQTTTTSTPIAATADESTGEASLDEFLGAGSERPGSFVGRVGRAMSMAGTIFAAGVIVALVAFARGRRHELRALIGWVRLAGFVVIAGGVTELAVLDESQSTAFGDLVGTKPGLAALLKIVAGALILIGFGEQSGSLVGAPRSLSAAAAVDIVERPPRTASTDAASTDAAPTDAAPTDVAPTDVAPTEDAALGMRWVPDVSAAVGFIGLALVLASYWFDGHTVSRGPWFVHAVANLVHVGAGAVWVGGVFTMTSLAVLRRRRSQPVDLAAMVIRFSSIAALSLTALAAAGVVMTWLVIDTPADLVSTDWGRVLLAKVVAVGIAAAMGGYNHLVLRPAMKARPDDTSLDHHLRTALLVESAALAVVIVLTAVLVGSAT